MIIEKSVKIRVTTNYNYYKKLGYECDYGDEIDVLVTHLPKGSKIKINVTCDVCGKEKRIEYRKYLLNYSNHNIYACSGKCVQVKIKKTKKINHGDENFNNIKKRKSTCIEKYNNENYKNVEKRYKTNLKKYGNKHVINNEYVLNKRKNTNKNRYGYEHPMLNIEILSKKRKTSYDLYGNENFNNIEKTLKTIKSKNISNVINKYNIKVYDYIDGFFYCVCDKGHNYKINYDLLYKREKYNVEKCTICNKIDSKESNSEKILKRFIEENYDGIIETKCRTIIKPYELDIYLPELNLAFEYNGLYWHSELHRDKYYHNNKTNMCIDKNIQLIHIWEDDWINKTDIIKSMILSKINKLENRIYGRKCYVKEIIDNNTIKDFLNENHIQGYTNSTTKLGLYYNNDLISLMTFVKNKNMYELNRFCNILNTSVIGSASKLFKYFLNNFSKNVYTFADKSYSYGDLYYKLGFSFDKEIKYDYKYIVNGIRRHKFNYRMKNEHNEMLKQGYYRIYDSGKIKFIYS